MSYASIRRGVIAVAGLSLVGATSAQAVVITDNFVASEAIAANGLQPLDLSGIVSGLTTNNSYTTNFASSVPGAYTGTLTARVYGNVGAPGVALDTVVIVYSFTGDGPSGIDTFEFGLDSSRNLDYSDLLAATHGTVGDLVTGGQLSPVVNLTDNLATNDTLLFDFNAVGDALGAPATTENFGWYIRTDGNVQVNFVDAVVTDFGAATVQTLSFVDVPGQPDLNVPGPAALGVLGVGVALSGARRRR